MRFLFEQISPKHRHVNNVCSPTTSGPTTLSTMDVIVPGRTTCTVESPVAVPYTNLLGVDYSIIQNQVRRRPTVQYGNSPLLSAPMIPWYKSMGYATTVLTTDMAPEVAQPNVELMLAVVLFTVVCLRNGPRTKGAQHATVSCRTYQRRNNRPSVRQAPYARCTQKIPSTGASSQKRVTPTVTSQ